MQKAEYTLSWEGFHSTMLTGFSSLQQNEELVDMTLAADGRSLKVHKVVFGIASSYIKELIQSADCKHPVIFLNRVSFKTLTYLIEYVYTGEVMVEEDQISDFFEAAKTLEIRGLSDTFHTFGVRAEPKDSLPEVSSEKSPNTSKKKFHVGTIDNKESAEVESPASTRIFQLKRKSMSNTRSEENSEKRFRIKEESLDNMSYDEADSGDCNEDEYEFLGQEYTEADEAASKEAADQTKGEDKNKPKAMCDFQYTVSNRGALQIILNRFMYNLSSRRDGGRVRLWRCVDYRNQGCPAAVVTENDMVVKRTNLHSHPFHDKRIIMKVERKAVYSAIRSEKHEAGSVETLELTKE